ncbi:MAG: RNA polymerase subunit sigma-70 [Deltaproteobacteria bacterium]|nr:RNA polymerase subunit sigma-70 [Deltaproteobacteria bacterium]
MDTDAQGELLAAARRGDGRAFDALTAPHRRGLLAHCYRMLGSVADADDAVQEALVRAWKYLPGYEARAALRSWLFSIATRQCLDMLEKRPPRRFPSMDEGAPSDPSRPPSAAVLDPVWLEPLADARWCEGPADETDGPEATVTRRQSVAVAFLAALQTLPATQRAALLLHDVAGWASAEIAEALETTPTAVNSALQRARGALDARAPAWERVPPLGSSVETEALSRYLRAWNTGDPGALASVLRADAVLAMPPVPDWYAGREAIRALFEGFIRGLGTQLIAAPATNGQPAFASYHPDPQDPTRLLLDGLQVLHLDGDGAVVSVLVFLGPEAALAQGLPAAREA